MSDANLTVREACRRRVPLDGSDAQALEHALTITEQERDRLGIKIDCLMRENHSLLMELHEPESPEGKRYTSELIRAEQRAGEAWAAGVRLAGEMIDATDGWLVCLRDFGDLYLDLKRTEEERDEALAEVERLRATIRAACERLARVENCPRCRAGRVFSCTSQEWIICSHCDGTYLAHRDADAALRSLGEE